MSIRISFAVLAAMLFAAALAYAGTPHERMAESNKIDDLEAVVPRQFGSWTVDTTFVPVTVSPEVQGTLDRIYSQVVSRTYVNQQGDRVMLSLAYGGTQSRELQVHRPEVCYGAQGFSVIGIAKASLSLGEASIPVMHVLTRLGAREEPVTYWVRIGDRIVRGNIEQGLARIAYGLTGKIPDGLLFRVSSISRDPELAYKQQEQFVQALMKAIPSSERRHLVGRVL